MMTEIMGFLIVLGAVIVILVRWQSRKENKPAEMVHQDMRYATQQLKQELERTGNEITSRLEQHVMNLEQLIHEADRRKSILEGRIVELRELVKLGDEQMDALHTLRSEIVEARQLRQQLVDAGRQASAMVQGQSVMMAPAEERNFSEVLNQSMMQDRPMQAYLPYIPQKEPVSYNVQEVAAPVIPSNAAQYEVREESVEKEIPQAAHIDMVEAVEEPLQEEQAVTDSSRVRALLLNGWSVEDVARETGIGRGAVELMKEMMRRQTMG